MGHITQWSVTSRRWSVVTRPWPLQHTACRPVPSNSAPSRQLRPSRPRPWHAFYFQQRRAEQSLARRAGSGRVGSEPLSDWHRGGRRRRRLWEAPRRRRRRRRRRRSVELGRRSQQRRVSGRSLISRHTHGVRSDQLRADSALGSGMQGALLTAAGELAAAGSPAATSTRTAWLTQSWADFRRDFRESRRESC